MPLPQDPNRAPLGLGLGLNPQNRVKAREAFASGSLDEFAATRPRAAMRFDRALQGGPHQAAAQAVQTQMNAARNNMGTPPPTLPTAPPAAPPVQQAAPAPAAAAAQQGGGADAQSFMGFLQNLFGAGQPFGMRPGTYSDPNNPMYGAAKSNLDQALAAIRARFAGSGLGHSGREALSEGQAASDFANQIATLGEGAYQSDASRALQAGLGGQQNLLAANAQLGNAGGQVTGIGQTEQLPPGMAALLQLLASLAGQTGTDSSKTKGQSGPLPGM